MNNVLGMRWVKRGDFLKRKLQNERTQKLWTIMFIVDNYNITFFMTEKAVRKTTTKRVTGKSASESAVAKTTARKSPASASRKAPTRIASVVAEKESPKFFLQDSDFFSVNRYFSSNRYVRQRAVVCRSGHF